MATVLTDEMKMYEEYLARLRRREAMLKSQSFGNYPISKLQHICGLNVYQTVNSHRTTKIMCALGTSSNTIEMVLAMMEEGMNIARINVTYLGYEETSRLIRIVRDAEAIYFKTSKERVSIALDIAAPNARIEKISLLSGTEEIIEGQSLWFAGHEGLIDDTKYNVIILNVTEFPQLIRYFLPRSRLYLDAGSLTVIVRENYGETVRCLVEQGGFVRLNCSVNFLWSQNFLYDCAQQYVKTINYAAAADIDIVMLSFIRDANTIDNIRRTLNKEVSIIMKMENYIPPNKLDEIINASDGVLISRGLLGIDLPIEKVFVLQNQIIAKCLHTVKAVYVGFQLLDSMITKPRPTRAEAADVANAVLASVDGLVLGKETSSGQFVLSSIDTMKKICLEAETTTSNFKLFQSIKSKIKIIDSGDSVDYIQSACLSAVGASYHSKATVIAVLTETGRSAFKIAALRPDSVVLVVSRRIEVIRACLMYKGLFAILYNGPLHEEVFKEFDNQLTTLLYWALEKKFLKCGDTFVCITGRKLGKGSTKTVRILTVPVSLVDFKLAQPATDRLSNEVLA